MQNIIHTMLPRISGFQVASHQVTVTRGETDASGWPFFGPGEGTPQLTAVNPHIGRRRWAAGTKARSPASGCG